MKININKVIDIITDNINKHEYIYDSINGVGNLSLSDLELTLAYVDAIKTGNTSFMSPVGNVKLLLDSFELEYNNYNIFK